VSKRPARIATETWEGFIFINLDPTPRQSLKDFIGEHADRLGGFPFGEMTALYEYYTILNCNWKIAWDAFSEAYHVPTVHGGSFPGVFEAAVKQVGMYGIHHSGAAHQKPSPPTAPVAALSYQLATASIAKPGFRSSLPRRINPDRDPEFVFDQSAIFPNFLVHVSEGSTSHISSGRFRWIRRSGKASNTSSPLATPASVSARNLVKFCSGTPGSKIPARWKRHSWPCRRSEEGFHFQDGEVMLRHNYQVIDEYVTRP